MKTSFFVNDSRRRIKYTEKDGHLWRKRMFTYGDDELFVCVRCGMGNDEEGISCNEYKLKGLLE